MVAKSGWRPQLTQQESRRGWVFFGIYFLVFPFLMAGAQRLIAQLLQLEVPVAQASLIYYFLSTALVFLVFWSFLRHALSLLIDWLPENLFAFSLGLAGFFVLSLLVGRIPLPVQNPITLDYPAQLALAPGATIMVVVVLMPIVEEVLFRGLLFGSTRRYSRGLAYGLSIAAFLLYSVWQHAVGLGDWRYLLLSVRYLPMALALTWCYDNGGSIWTPIALHMVMSGITLFAVTH